MTGISAQFALAFQSLRKTPGFVLSVVMTMSCTLAVVFVVASVVNAYFIRPLKVLDEQNLYVVEQQVQTEAGTHTGYQSYKGIVHWMRTQQSLDKAAAISPANVTLMGVPGEPNVVSTFASAEYFTLFEVPILFGRGFEPGTAFDQARDEVLISERIWAKHFERAEDVLGKTLMIQGGKTFSIVGVVKDDFAPPYMFFDGKSDIWMLFGNDPRFFNDGEWDNPWDNTYGSLKIIGIAKPGLQQQDIFADFDASIEAIRPEWLAGYPMAQDIAPVVRPFRTVELGDKGHLSLFLLAATLGLLLIAILNVSNLLLSRALAQHRTLALQAVLGAKRRTLLISIFAQTLLLMLSSVLLALFMAAWGVRGFKHLTAGQLPLLSTVQIDGLVVLLALAVCLLLAYLFAWVSASLVDFSALRKPLQQSGKNTGQTLSSTKTRLLVGCQMGIATALILVAAFSLGRTHDTLSRPLGNQVENRFNLVLFIPGENFELSATEIVERRQRMQQHLSLLPQVRRVSLGNSPVIKNISASTLIDAKGVETVYLPQSWVGHDFFEHAGMEIIAGRTFSDAAMRGESLEMLVSEATATLLDPKGDVLGKVYTGHGEKYEIVGITENFNHPNHYHRDQGRHLWWPMGAVGYSFMVEFKGGAAIERWAMLDYVRQQDERFFLWEFTPLEDELAQILHIDKIALYGSYLLAGFTLALACVGIFGVLSYNLNMRRFEFGLRMALGTKTSRLYRLLARDILMPLLLGTGLAAGITLALLLSLADSLQLWLSYSPVFAVPAVLLSLLFAILCGLWPMRTVIKRQPMHALRNE